MDKWKKIRVGVAVAGVAVLIVALYLVFGGGGKDEKEAIAAVKSMAASMGAGNKDAVGLLTSKKFSDAGLDFNAVSDELGIKHPGLMVDGVVAKVNEMQATVSYTRKEIVDKKQLTVKVSGEIWQKEDDGKWRLLRLSPTDRVQIPKRRKERIEKEEKMKAELAAAEAAEEAARNIPYTPAGKRDPFESLIVEGMGEEGAAKEGGIRCDPERPREFLEGFDLFSFKVVGIVFSNGYYALVEGQNGNGYTLKPGMHVGRRCGVVTKITSGKVVVAEKYPTVRGAFITRDVELKMKDVE